MASAPPEPTVDEIEQQIQAIVDEDSRRLLLKLWDARMADLMRHQQAAYLLGVQIGLRLRGEVR